MKLKTPNLTANLEVKLIDKNGTTVYYWYGPSHSWVKNAYNYVLAITGLRRPATADSTQIISATGTNLQSVPYRFSSSTFMTWVATGTSGTVATAGPIIGTGTGAESFTDYALGTIIADGTGTGQMQHAYWYNTYALDGTTRKNKLERTFTNNSGASIIVSECGLYGYQSNTLFMMNRDLLDAAVTVADGQSINIAYDMALDFGA